MTKRRTTGPRPINGRGALRPIRLVLETLESRRLLAGVDFAACGSHSTIPSPLGTDSALSMAQPVVDSHQPLSIQQFDLQAEGESSGNEYTIPENAELGTRLGTIDGVDPTEVASSVINVSDPRFSVLGNQLYFSSGALDHDMEPLIRLSITVAKTFGQSFETIEASVSVSRANERPLAIELNGGQVREHEPGAVVGELSVVDPDTQDDYAFFIFDSRFVVTGHQLRLADNVELDYEVEPEVMLAVAATDGVFEIFDTVRIEVLPATDAPALASSIMLDGQKLAELSAGANVGSVTVVNPKDGSYQFTISDARFEMRGNRLKLRDDQQVNALVDSEIALTIDATGDSGDRASGTFVISVINIRSPYHNHNLNEDVNGDGYVSPIDALLIINDLNSNGAHPVPSGIGATGEPPSQMLDVNGDGIVTPLDALLIINRLNSRASVRNQHEASSSPGLVSDPQADSNPIGSGPVHFAPNNIVSSERDGANRLFPDSDDSAMTIAIPSASNTPMVSAAPSVVSLASERRQRENASIDAELEDLLDQLSREQTSLHD